VNVDFKLCLAYATNKYIYYLSIKSLIFFAFVSLGKSCSIEETSLKVAYGVYQSHDYLNPQTNEVPTTSKQGQIHKTNTIRE